MSITNSFLSFAFVIILLSGFLPLNNLFQSASAISATGGTITYSDGKTIHTFTTSGTFTVTESGTVDYLVVAGGGGAGAGSGKTGGGGGAGGYKIGINYAVTAQSYTITIGAGGAGGPSGTSGSDGGNSIFDTITSIGGGGGGAGADPGGNGRTGGSGGGGGGSGTSGASGGSGTSGQGNNGGNAHISSGFGGGGGGASGVGSDGLTGSGGIGGAGLSSSISGSTVTYAKGGDASSNIDGTANKGEGGGSNAVGTTGKQGGSGIVIISYVTLPQTGSNNSSGDTLAITTSIPPITILSGEQIPLLDVSSIGNLTSISITVNLSCDTTNSPLLKIVAGILGNTTNVISSSGDSIGKGPINTCLYSDSITNVTNAGLPAINRVFLNHTGSSPVHIPPGVMVTITGIFK